MRKHFTTQILVLGLALSSFTLAQDALWRLQSDQATSLEIYSNLTPIELNKIHSWQLVLRGSNGEDITGANIQVTGGMPLHDHGLPTLPQVSPQADPGRYLLEGVRFHMPGPWQLLFTVTHGNSTEVFQLDFTL